MYISIEHKSKHYGFEKYILIFVLFFYIPYNFKVLSIEVDAMYEPWVPNLIPVAKAYSIKNINYFSVKLKFIPNSGGKFQKFY